MKVEYECGPMQQHALLDRLTKAKEYLKEVVDADGSGDLRAADAHDAVQDVLLHLTHATLWMEVE